MQKEIKKNVIPHIFACQKKVLPCLRQTGQKRLRAELIKDAMIMGEPMRNGTPDPEPSTSTTANLLSEPSTSTAILNLPEAADSNCKMVDKAVQADIRCRVTYRSKSTSTVPTMTNTACSPLKFSPTKPVSAKSGYCGPTHNNIDIMSTSSEDNDSDYTPSALDSDSNNFDGSEIDTGLVNLTMRKSFMLVIQREPRLCLGIPKEMYHIISIVVAKAPTETINVLIALKKIRLDDSFAILALHFGLSPSSVSRIFSRTIKILATLFQELIIWPTTPKIRAQLPISFRARYGNVQSIIDCLEIQIEKPSNPIHQSMCWSEYKGCNTLKYLISCTPDGLVNYVSCGYGGRASDAIIIEDCGYLSRLRPGMSVMADRGFKNISHILQQMDCELIRPPSVFANVHSSREEVKQSKRIAALRIHIERVISRIREFQMLRMHASTDHNHIPIIDNIIIVVCGLINLQGLLIKM